MDNSPVFSPNLSRYLSRVSSARLQRIAELLQQGELTASVGQVLPLDAARIAHEIMDGQRSAVRGKSVLRP